MAANSSVDLLIVIGLAAAPAQTEHIVALMGNELG
jgi:hypothetical protein